MKINKNYLTYDITLIQYIEIKISLKNNITYWVKVNNTLKRIAKIYFFILKKKGLLLKERQKKNQCLAIIKSKKSKFFNSRCSNLTNENNDYCGIHKYKKKPLIVNNIEYIKSKELNQYYTNKSIVDLCMELYLNNIKIDRELDLIIEPSAGNGSFITNLNNLCNNTIFIDIDPKVPSILKKNFLLFNDDIKKYNAVHVLGNPPFNDIKLFLKKACVLADNIGFILPLSFRKLSMKKRFPLNFHCILEYILPKNNFTFNNKVVTIPTVFQIWKKYKYNRTKLKRVSCIFFTFVKKNKQPDIAFCRVGSKSGTVYTFIEDKSVNSYYFIKFSNGITLEIFLSIFNQIKFDHKNTVAQRSISQQELIILFNKIIN